MLSGFNTNFRYRGVLFHVQTEDSGLENPHVITHLFHGGNIMASEKRDYSDLLDQADREGAVRKLMETQHKAMLHQLSRGEHDVTIEQRLGADVFLATDGDASDVTDPPPVTEEERPPPRRGIAETTQAEAIDFAGPGAGEADAAPGVAEPTRLEPQEVETTGSSLSRVFGDRVVSEKPLDEVVLDYLVENARKRRRQPK